MKKLAVSVPRLALTPPEAAAAVGVSPGHFDEYISADLRWVRRGRKRMVPVPELERWLDENAEASLSEQVSA